MNSSCFFLSFWVYIQLPTFAVKTPVWLTFHWESIFDQNSSNTHPNRMGLVSLYSRREILSYELKLIFLSFCRNFIIHAWIWGSSAHVHQVWELSNYDLHQDCKSSSILIHMHTQAFRKISQLVNFKLFPCDLSPPLKHAVGGFLKDHKMRYTHPNSVSSVDMDYRM